MAPEAVAATSTRPVVAQFEYCTGFKLTQVGVDQFRDRAPQIDSIADGKVHEIQNPHQSVVESGSDRILARRDTEAGTDL